MHLTWLQDRRCFTGYLFLVTILANLFVSLRWFWHISHVLAEHLKHPWLSLFCEEVSSILGSLVGTRISFKFLDLLWLTMKDFWGKIFLFSGSEYKSLRFFLMTALTLSNRGSHFMIKGIRSVYLLADFLSALSLLIFWLWKALGQCVCHHIRGLGNRFWIHQVYYLDGYFQNKFFWVWDRLHMECWGWYQVDGLRRVASKGGRPWVWEYIHFQPTIH